MREVIHLGQVSVEFLSKINTCNMSGGFVSYQDIDAGQLLHHLQAACEHVSSSDFQRAAGEYLPQFPRPVCLLQSLFFFFFLAFVNLLSRDRLGYVVVSDNLLELDQCLLSTFERPEYPRTRIYWIAEIGQSIDSP